MKTMKQSLIVTLILSLVLVLVVSCTPKPVQTAPTGEAAISPEEQDISAGLDDLEELDTLGTASEDVSFEDLDALGYGQ